ncbi:phosphatidate cytidylyltransferase [Microbacterium sp. bgisy207]|uniref:phosphatidate cytidylyltransferase n=1 Tax=Microbacterium sp. bgisy207 TaxID=3413800 RepID=UPI003EBFFEE0
MTDDRSDARLPGDPAGVPAEDPGAGFQAHVRTARSEFEQHVAHARAEFEEANERIKKRTGRDLILAILIGVGIGAVALLSLIFVKWVFILLALGVVVLGVVEFSRALTGSGRRIDLAPQLVASVVVLLSGAFLELWLHWVALFAALVFVVVWRLIAQMAAADARPYTAVTSDVLAGTFVVFYVPFLASMAMILLRQEGGEWWIIAFIAVAVVADTAAYASGLTFGKHPMAPRISPNKTWEGFGGAVVGAVAAGILLGVFLLGVPWWAGAIFGALILGTATTGDLGESMVKRDLGIKDMSSWLPGHGGVLDRLDSILPSATAALALYYLFAPVVAA